MKHILITIFLFLFIKGAMSSLRKSSSRRADKGVGLWAGQVMLSLDNANQYIDWWHEALPESDEGFDHNGTLYSLIVSTNDYRGSL